MAYLFEEKTQLIIKIFYKVYNSRGYGFLEKVCENAMIYELRNNGFLCESQRQIKVFYDGIEVGVYYPDIIVDETIILELKVSEYLLEENEFQLINYLKATEIEIGLLLNFGKIPEIKRKIFTNDRKLSIP